MSDKAVEREAARARKRRDGGEIVRLPFGRDAQARLAHEGGGKGEGDAGLVKSREHDLPAGGETLDQRVDERSVARGVADHAIVAAGIVVGIDDRVAGRARAAGRVLFPDRRRLRPRRDSDAGDQSAENAMTDDQLGMRIAREGVTGCGGERQQGGVLAERGLDRRNARAWNHEGPGSGAEQAADLSEALSAGDEDELAGPAAGSQSGFDDAPDRLVSGDERVAHSRKLWHPACPEQPFGPRRDAGKADLDDHVLRVGRVD